MSKRAEKYADQAENLVVDELETLNDRDWVEAMELLIENLEIRLSAKKGEKGL